MRLTHQSLEIRFLGLIAFGIFCSVLFPNILPADAGAAIYVVPFFPIAALLFALHLYLKEHVVLIDMANEELIIRRVFSKIVIRSIDFSQVSKIQIDSLLTDKKMIVIYDINGKNDRLTTKLAPDKEELLRKTFKF